MRNTLHETNFDDTTLLESVLLDVIKNDQKLCVKSGIKDNLKIWMRSKRALKNILNGIEIMEDDERKGDS